MELGCFLAGALLSTQGHMVTTEVMGCIEPIRDFLAIIFFASIGQKTVLSLIIMLQFCAICVETWLNHLVCRCGMLQVSMCFQRLCCMNSPSCWFWHSHSSLWRYRTFFLFCSFSFSGSRLTNSHFLVFYLFPVRDGRSGSVSDPASGLPAHTVGGLRWACAGQRILLRLGQPCPPGWHHLQRSKWFLNIWTEKGSVGWRCSSPVFSLYYSCLLIMVDFLPSVRFFLLHFLISLCPGVPAGSQCHHSQFAAGSCVVESHHTQMCSPSRAQNSNMTWSSP